MPAETSRAILLRRTRYSESSLILTWFCDQGGKIKTIAKGALRPKSTFYGKIDLFYLCEIVLRPSHRSELHTLTEVTPLETFGQVRTRYLNTLAAAYFAELIEQITEPEHEERMIFDLLLRAYRYLDREVVTESAVVFFEAVVGRALGLANERSLAGSKHLLESLHRIPETRRALLGKLRDHHD